MNKLIFIIQIEQWGIRGIWQFQAVNPEEVALKVISDPQKYHDLLQLLGGLAWSDKSHRAYDPPTPEELLERLYDFYTWSRGSYEFHVYELNLEKPEDNFAREIHKGEVFRRSQEVSKLV